MLVVYSRDFMATWSIKVHSIRQISQIYGTLLEEFPERHGDIVDDEHRFSSTDRWLVGDDHTGFRGHATSMCPGS